MIVKIHPPSSSIRNTLAYNFKKVKEGGAELILTKNMRLDYLGNESLERTLKHMREKLPYRPRTKNIVFHCSINPHPTEQIDTETYQSIAEDYLEKMGYGKQPYVVFQHNDIDRHHIHIISLRVDTQGKKINDSHERWRSMEVSKELERKYNLKKVDRTLKRERSIKEKKILNNPCKDISEKVEVSKGNIKQQIAEISRKTLKEYLFLSIGEMNAIIETKGVRLKETRVEYAGKKYDGVIYMAINKEGKEISPPIEGAKLGRGLGIAALRGHFKRSKVKIESHKNALREIIREAASQNKTLEGFLKRLKTFEIEAIIRRTDTGRIYGITFVDNFRKIAVNGSRLGKEYSATKFNEYYNTPSEKQEYKDENHSIIQNNFILEQRDTPNEVNVEENASIGNDVVDTLLSMLTSHPSTIDEQKEQAWQKKLKAKLKRKNKQHGRGL